MSESDPRLIRDIRAQPESLAQVLDTQWGSGQAALRRAAALLESARTVVIVGMGASLNAGIPLEYLLCSRGIDACCVEAGEFLHFRREAYRDAVLIVISRSGESVEIVKLLEQVRGRMSIVAVTNEAKSTLALVADIALFVHSLSDEFVAIQTYTGTLLTLYLLGMAATQQLDTARRELDRLFPLLPSWIVRCLQQDAEWKRFLTHDAQIYCLGRGPSYGSALQSALLFGEIAKTPVVGMAVATFRHGPVEVTGPRFRGLLFAPGGATAPLNRALAEDLLRFGGDVRMIGPASTGEDTVPRITTPDGGEALAPLLEIIPVQIAAVRLAQSRGLTVGRMRFAPQVARDEAHMPEGHARNPVSGS
jgi:glucosamine--fructose-6-phosphate aminotransferase (isomerizing)